MAYVLLLEQVERRAMTAGVDPQEWRDRFDEWLTADVEAVDVERAELLAALGLR